MSSEEVKAAGVEGSKRAAGGVLHQRRHLPFSLTTMAIGGLVITAAVGYTVLYTKKKPEASAKDVVKAVTNTGDPKDTHPRK